MALPPNHTARCGICERELNNVKDPRSVDCGGHCLQCMADAGDPDCVEEIQKIEADEAKYVFHNYGHLMTPKEKLAFSHLGGTMKATMGRSDPAAQGEVKAGSTHLRRAT